MLGVATSGFSSPKRSRPAGLYVPDQAFGDIFDIDIEYAHAWPSTWFSCVFGMRFSNCLQGNASHEALLTVQDVELQLLETIKRCICTRIKCDRDYALALNNVCLQAQKFTKSQELPGSCVTNAWKVIMEETELLGKMIRHNADYLCAYTLEMVNWLISEKKASRKVYVEEHAKLENELLEIQDAVMKTKVEYQRQLPICQLARQKFEESYAKGKCGRKLDEAKENYVKCCKKLHRIHNEYVLLLNEASHFEADYRTSLLPGLLEFQQTVQEDLTHQCKVLLKDYTQHTDFTSGSFRQMQIRMSTNVEGIVPAEEYREFIEKNKTTPLLPIAFVFDHELIEDYTGKLRPNKITVDDLTHSSLKEKMFELEDRLKECHGFLEEKQSVLTHFEKEVETLRATTDASTNTFVVKKRASDILKKEVNELKCKVEKYKRLHNIIDTSLSVHGDDDPPSGVELPNDMDCLSVGSGSEGALSRLHTPRQIVELLRRPFSKRQVVVSSSLSPSCNSLTQDCEDDCSSSPTPPPVEVTSQSLTCSTGGALCSRSLHNEDWFHGVLPREEVVRLLANDGDFLVRETLRNEERQIVLSVCWNGHKHFITQTTVEGLFRFEGPSFPSIQDLIVFQHKSGHPVTNKSGAILKTPILRERWELNNDDIELVSKIGRGNFGDVYRARLRTDGMEVAAKTCRINLPEEQKKKFLQEGRILKQYNHPNIVQFIGICVQKQPIMIIMELVPGGSLLTYLRSSGSSLGTHQQLVMCVNAAAGMEYLESKNCIHRDLAARNCLIGHNNVVKISDFGMSREEEEYIVSDGMKQIPIKWTAPEALNFGKYTCLSDVWSFGVLIWEIFSAGNTPYSGMTNSKAREMIDSGYRMPAPDGTPDEVYQLLLRCWEYDPEKRPHFCNICSSLHALVAAYNGSSGSRDVVL